MLSRITQRQLEYFIACGEAGSIVKASEQIHVSSPSISAAISHIESELGIQLLIRHHAQGISLTVIGQRVLQEAKLIVEQTRNLYSLASDSLNTIRGPLRIGCFDSLAPMISAELVYGFARAFPGVKITQIEGDHEELLEGLRRSQLDIALTYDLNDVEDVDFLPLADLPPHIIVGEQHPFAELSAVSISDTEDFPMVLLDLPYSREYFISLFMNESVRPNIMMRSSQLEVVRSMVANGLGYSIANVRPKVNRSQDGKRIVRVRLAGDHRPMRLGYAMLKEVNQPRVVEAFAHRCRTFISNQYIPGMSAPSFYDPHIIDTVKLSDPA
ncbi:MULTISPECIES: LysR substrate-binding domain-containing protein [Halomonadaceae]|uniref:LysR family transcriptional regulator n=2 Tax=Vreelandella TaxID=3137766 RepID=A0A7Z0LWK9_9GAMM|nr:MULTISPECIES: LysR substrate-binding domain-containing protein [Halomonas]NYS79943.1 LysR family transcriptional regulator [Halomonas glaciei]